MQLIKEILIICIKSLLVKKVDTSLAFDARGCEFEPRKYQFHPEKWVFEIPLGKELNANNYLAETRTKLEDLITAAMFKCRLTGVLIYSN